MIANRPSLDHVRMTPIGEVAALPADQLALLQEEADAAFDTAKSLKDWVAAAIDLRYRDRAACERAARNKDAGTVRFDDGPVTVIAELPKRVKWDQAALSAVVERIRAAGDDPAEYIGIEYRVSERAFAAWPQAIRATFAPARTVETGKPAYRLECSEDR